MSEKLTSDSMIRDTRELALRAFKNHVITRRPHPRSWVLQRLHADGGPDMAYATEIVALEFRGLYVGGDIAPVIFGGGPADPMGRVFWMGETTSWGYVQEKAQSGLGCNGKLTEQWVRELAHADLRQHIEDSQADAHAEGTVFNVDECHLAAGLQADDKHAFYEAAFEALGGWKNDAHEAVAGMGCTLDARVIYAHAALTRLSVLLRAELAAQTGVAGA